MHTSWNAGTQDSINGLMTRAVQRHPDRPFLDFLGTLYSYAEIDRESDRLAQGLRKLGVEPGECVGSILDNSVEAVLALLAICKLGAVSVPVNTGYKGEFLRHQLSDSKATIVIAESDYVERVLAVAEGLPEVRVLVCRGAMPARDHSPFVLKSLLDVKTDAKDFVAHPIKPGDISMLIYTSGTTGPSKGCMISHNYPCNLARQVRDCIELSPQDTLWTPMPLFHMNALASILACAMQGARCSVYPRFSLSGFWPDIERSGATCASLLGSMIPLIAEAADTEISKRCHGQLRMVGGAPFPPDVQEKWRTRFGVSLLGTPGYGLTEAALVTTDKLGAYAKPGSSGRRNDDFDVMIVDADDIEVPPGVAGEIVVRPKRPHVCFEGYWNRPGDTLKIMRNMWLHTGDIGKFDAEGFFHFLDRKKDYLRRRGENISSYEMEATFRAHPDIMDVAVHAVFSELGEDDVKVTAVLRENTGLTEETLCLWSAERLPYFAVPRYIEFRNDLPRNPTGKVLKYQLREEGCTGTTWDRDKSGIKLVKR
jgi:carnitine-CoA ligase